MSTNPSSISNPHSGLLMSPGELEIYRQTYGDQFIPFTPTDFQTRCLLRQEKEIALLGGKFGGKSFCARMFLLKGNPHLPNFSPQTGQPILTNQSYIYNDNYRATILRRNQIDLDDFVRKFLQMVRPYGGDYRNGQFVFPGISTAVISCGHLADKDAWQKYIGVENTRFVIEEAALIPEFSLYEQILTCCRSVYSELIPQVMLTSNAGGPGTGWIIDRFYEAKDKDGIIIPHDTPIYETHPDPYEPDKEVTTTRIFMFSTMKDNPHADKDPSYKATMAAITDEKMRKAYIYGDWRVYVGAYFQDFRPKGPLIEQGEPSWANHVLSPPYPILAPWWHRWGSIDVGQAHETAVYWFCLASNGQHHIYQEFVVDHMSYVQIGYEIATRSIDILNSSPTHSLVFGISHDAIHSKTGRDQKSIAELIAMGIAKRIGPDAVHLPDLLIRDLKEAAISDNHDLAEDTIKAIRSTHQAGITLMVAPYHRVIGWQYCREALRWTQTGPDRPPYDPELANALLLNFPEKYEEYQSLYRYYKPEILPKLQIWSCCSRLIDAIPKARHYPLDSGKNPEDVDTAHFFGMDSLDSWRYGEMSYHEIYPEEPWESYRDRMLDSAISHDPGIAYQDKVMWNRIVEAEYQSTELSQSEGFTVPRRALVRQRAAFMGKLDKGLIAPPNTPVLPTSL